MKSYADERLDDLQLNGLMILQKRDGFRFGMDAVLLADFTRVQPGDRIADMGTGTGILPLLLSQKQTNSTFEAFEIQPAMADMAGRSVEMNGLSERIHIHEADLRTVPETLGHGQMDGVVVNPPYGVFGSGMVSQRTDVRIATYEERITLSEIALASSRVLRNHGRLSMVFPARRVLEACDALRQVSLEPKRMRMVCVQEDKAPYLTLIEAMKNAKPGLSWMPPLIVRDREGRETPEIDRIYHRRG